MEFEIVDEDQRSNERYKGATQSTAQGDHQVVVGQIPGIGLQSTQLTVAEHAADEEYNGKDQHLCNDTHLLLPQPAQPGLQGGRAAVT